MSERRSMERAFVVQFDPVEDTRLRLRGRVELVASGEATRFRSLRQLVRFMADVVRRQASEGQRADS
jgi:hypothetical protein